MADDSVIDIISSISEEALEKMDGSASQWTSICLSTSLVLKKILENFSNHELLKLSLVNKLWNYEARRVLRDRGTLIAVMGPGTSCQDLVAFVSDLEKMNVVPFSGICIAPHKGDRRCGPSPTEALDPTHLVHLDRVQWKHLSITFDDEDSEQLMSCPAFLVVKKILEDFCGLLEELVLNLDYEGVICLGQVLEERSFPHLKTLKFGDLFDNCLEEAQTDFIKMLVPLAPNLQELHLSEWNDFKEIFLDGTSAVLALASDGDFDLTDNDFSKSLVDVVKLKRMSLKYLDDENCSLKVFKTIIPGLLQSSHSTLCSLCIDAVLVVPLMCYGICLENVIDFEISMDFRELKRAYPRVLSLLKGFDFTRMFPNLAKVQVEKHSSELSAEQIGELIDQWDTNFEVPMPNRAVNIKHVYLHNSLEDCNVAFFAGMFPNIEILTLYEPSKDLLQIPFRPICEHWGNLKELKVENSDACSVLVESVLRKSGLGSLLSHNGSSHGTRTENLDSVACGIFPEELVELRAKDDEYLKTVNIVPVMPSITCMRALKIFKLSLVKVRNRGRADNSTFVFSKVSGLVAFGRCPALSVVVETDSPDVERALSHIKPYASVVLDYELGESIGMQ